MALILPVRIYLKKVGLEILKYFTVSSVVKTLSISIEDMNLSPFYSFLFIFRAIYVPNTETFIHLTRSYWSLLVNFSLNIVSLTKKLLHFEIKFCSILVILRTTLSNIGADMMQIKIRNNAPLNYSERLIKVVIARSTATCLRAEALRRASAAISWDCFTSFAMTPHHVNLFMTFTINFYLRHNPSYFRC